MRDKEMRIRMVQHTIHYKDHMRDKEVRIRMVQHTIHYEDQPSTVNKERP